MTTNRLFLFCTLPALVSNTPITARPLWSSPAVMKAKMGATMTKRATSLAERLKDSVVNVTKDWAKQRKSEERHASALENRRARLIRASDYYNFRSAAFEVMEKAYLAASANDTLPASARQVMYQARPFIQEMMGGQQLNDQYFCQQL